MDDDVSCERFVPSGHDAGAASRRAALPGEGQIAHEIAHRWLGKDTEYGVATPGGLEAEMAADDLCEKWDFGRAYDNYDQFD